MLPPLNARQLRDDRRGICRSRRSVPTVSGQSREHRSWFHLSEVHSCEALKSSRNPLVNISRFRNGCWHCVTIAVKSLRRAQIRKQEKAVAELRPPATVRI